MRGGRLVVVLQSGAKGRTGGLIHGRSATGRSYYFEPLEVVDSNNSLQQSVEDEEGERRRILGELIDAAAGRHSRPAPARRVPRRSRSAAGVGALRQSLQRRAARDRRPPRAAPHRGAPSAARPLPGVGARGGPGPAGPRGDIVPLAIELSAGRRILVVTGPNAGGKTVSLKTDRRPRPDGHVRAADPRRPGQPGALPLPPGGDRRRRAGPAGRPLHLQRPAAAPQGGLGGGGAGQPRAARRAGLGHRSGRGGGPRLRPAGGAAGEGEPGDHHHPPRPARRRGPGVRRGLLRGHGVRSRHRPAHLPAGARVRRAPARRWPWPAGWGCRPSGWTAPRRAWAPSTATCAGSSARSSGCARS